MTRRMPLLLHCDGQGSASVVAGIVSIGDVVKTRMEELETEQQHLQDYITQGG